MRDKKGTEEGEGGGKRWREREREKGSDRVLADKSPQMTFHSLKKSLLAISILSCIRYQIVCVTISKTCVKEK